VKHSIRDTWASDIDDAVRSASHPLAWGTGALMMLASCWVLGSSPIVGDVFQLPLDRALPRWLIVTMAGMPLSVFHYYRGLSRRWLVTHLTINPLLLQAFLWSWVVECQPPAALSLSAIPILIAAYQSYLTQLSLRHPYVAIGTLAASAWAIAASEDAQVRAAIAVSSGIGLAVDFWLGANARRNGRLLRERDEFRHAIEAQLLAEKGTEVRVQSEVLDDLRGFVHDCAGAITGLVARADKVATRLRSIDPSDQARELAASLASSVEGLSNMTQRARSSGLRVRPALEQVAVRPVVEELLADVRAIHRIDTHLDAGDPTTSVAMRGGSSSLHRILGNLLRNACEGDGRRGARRIDVIVRDRDGRVDIEVRDDGPGFDPAQLDAPTPALSSTKENGLGLGLYTVERLVHASGGYWHRANDASGGARVSVHLPAWPSAS
jgi:two-component system, NtrC family, C4-dicarboxylate transport sensor histidine kinase DctB